MKRTPLKRRTPLKQRRDTPRRATPKRKPDKSAAERRYHAYVALMPCVGCGAWPVEVHHVVSDGYKRLTRNHRLVLPACPECHRTGPNAIHRIGHAAWNVLHGIVQHVRAARLWEDFDG